MSFYDYNKVDYIERNTFVFADILEDRHSKLSQSFFCADVLSVVCGCEAGWMYSETPLKSAHGRVMNVQFKGNNSAGHASCTKLSKLVTSVTLCCYETTHLIVAFYCEQFEVQ